MAGAPLTPRLHGLRISVADSAAAATVLERVLLAPRASRASRDTARWPRLQLAGHWLELRGGGGDAMTLQCADLALQRAHLRRLGIEPLDGAALGCAPCLRLEAADTGACGVDLHAAPPAPHGNGPAPAAQLCGIELAVRSPERVARHWAQLFHASAARNAQGLPALPLDGLELRFVLAGDGQARVSAMALAVRDLAALAQRAAAQHIDVRQLATGQAGFEAHGIRFALRQAG